LHCQGAAGQEQAVNGKPHEITGMPMYRFFRLKRES